MHFFDGLEKGIDRHFSSRVTNLLSSHIHTFKLSFTVLNSYRLENILNLILSLWLIKIILAQSPIRVLFREQKLNHLRLISIVIWISQSNNLWLFYITPNRGNPKHPVFVTIMWL